MSTSTSSTEENQRNLSVFEALNGGTTPSLAEASYGETEEAEQPSVEAEAGSL